MTVEEIDQMKIDLERKITLLIDEVVDSISKKFSKGTIGDFREFVNKYVKEMAYNEEVINKVRREVDKRIERIEIEGLPSLEGSPNDQLSSNALSDQ